MDEAEDLTVGQGRKGLAKSRRTRIDVRADRCSAPAVETVADRAILLKQRRTGSKAGLSG